MAAELRITDTNSAEDSGGLVWGIEGNLFWWIAGGAFCSVISLLLLFSVWKIPFLTSLTVAAIPMTAVLVYVFLFKQNRPPFFDIDNVERLIGGRGFAPKAGSQPEHPLRHV